MNVLYVTNCYPTAEMPWYGIFVKREVESISDMGVKTDLLFINGRRSRLEYVTSIAKINTKVQIIHSYYGYSGVVSWARTIGVKSTARVVTFLGDDLLGTAKLDGRRTAFSLMMASLHKRLATQFDAIIVQSEQMEEQLPKAARKRCHVIPFGIDLNRFRPLNKVESRKKLNLLPERIYILFPADPNNSVKNFRLLHKAKQEIKQCEILVLKGIKEEEVPLYYNACDAVVLCSFSEGSPTVVKEAMSCNRPIVSTDVGDVRKLFGTLDGYFISGYDHADLAKNINNAVKFGNTRGRDRLGELGLDSQSVASRIVQLYKNLI